MILPVSSKAGYVKKRFLQRLDLAVTLPTIKDVARLAGVSVATVSKALNASGKVSDELKARVAAAAQTLGYAPHASARSLRSGATRILGLLVADITNPFFLRLVESIERIASVAGYSVILCNSGESAEREQRNLQMLLSQRADGIILMPTRETWPNRLATLSSLPMPAILVDRMLDGLDVDSVTIDNRLAGRLAAEHLLELGHRRVGVVMGSPEHQIARHRLDGFRDGFTAGGLALDEQMVCKNNFTEAAAHDAAIELLSRPIRPTAVFATNNHMAFGVFRAISELGLAVPQDISVVTVDRLPWIGIAPAGVTAVVQPTEEIAQAAVATLQDRIAGRVDAFAGIRSTVLEPHLEMGGSTSSPKERS